MTAHVPAILRGVLIKLKSVQMLSNQQGLITVFAQLLLKNWAEVMAFLQSQGAVEFVFKLWVKRQENFFGRYCINATIAALATLFASRTPMLAGILVDGDEVPQAEAGIRTRSKAKAAPTVYQQIPLFAKIGKVLVKEYGSMVLEAHEEAAAAREEAAGDDGDDGDWEDEDDEADVLQLATKSGLVPADEFHFLSDPIDLSGMVESDLDIADEDERQDPLYKMDLKAHIVAQLKLFAKDPAAAAELTKFLTPREQQTVRHAITSAP